MQLSNILALLALSTGALGFKFVAFTEDNCQGAEATVNVWDNTCREQNVPGTRSIRVLNLGGRHQRAEMYNGGSCAGSPGKGWWADGGEDPFQVGNCINLGFNARAYGSRSA
ncbi:hypothetical protein BS50DRAFT_592790 [Corynespora cassiicola Philippines]|uniref:Uncharacterized protein n=1 Tax=Corynespora cassiicola Philippines TaxID=1448308 RepID=A0A2T2N8V5_CORCC|nr:hypothetical protein BS50DRAFT_592790 [Corynespora cassiicola Philippines]